jgi:hypothetical protein
MNEGSPLTQHVGPKNPREGDVARDGIAESAPALPPVSTLALEYPS